MRRIIDFFNSLFFWAFKERKIEYFDLLDEYEDYVRDVDISVRNTLLGTVKTKEQYETNLEYCFYHIPANSLDNPEDVKYVALYRSKNIFNSDTPGVLHYSKVTSFEKLKRFEIKELKISLKFDSYYYRFNVAKWETLTFPVKAREKAPIVAYMTNLYLIHNSKYAYELFLKNNDECKLYRGLTDIIYKVYDGFFVGDFKVYINFSRIIIVRPKGKFYFKLKDYKKKPYETFLKIKEVIFPSFNP